MRIIVIGGGIAGLSAAHRLVELGSEKNLSLDIVLLEGRERVGGVIATKVKDGFLIEEGPDSFITTKPWAFDLCRRLGLGSQLINTNDDNRRTFVVRSGELIPIPDGLFMIAPTQFKPFLTSPLFSWHGKLRVLMDLVIPAKADRDDESLAAFVTRRLGREALERLAQPMIGGIYTADPEKLSMRATMPRFLEMEEQHGSIIRAMLHEQKKSKRIGQEDSGARYSLFMSLKDGMETLVNSITSHLPKGVIKLTKQVKDLEFKDNNWHVTTDQGESFSADAVIIAVASNLASKLVKGFDQPLSGDLSRIQFASSVVINMAYRRKDILHSLNGFVVPAVEGRSIIACSFSSVKFPGRAPEGFALLRCFMGGAVQPYIYERDEAALTEIAHEELSQLLQIKGDPVFVLLHRYPNSMPQYHVGHLELVSRIFNRVDKYRGLALAGSGYHGVGIPDCVHSGEMAAEKVIRHIG
jgi:oxygen-dependent protoporphyrinogen oxidase